MSHLANIKRLVLASASASALLIVTPIVVPFVTPAFAQTDVAVSVEFRTALTPYGRWQSVPRWGEVWIPSRTTRDWQPYTVGNWIYSEDYGWYWISSDEEAEWGWITFHYGRWINLDATWWAWVPGNEWGPAWVDWRRSDDYAGWAPLPPDELIVEYRDNPKFWMFVRMGELAAPHLRNAFLPYTQRQATLQRTVNVNRTLLLNDRRFGVNPGIAPAIIAKAARQPVRTFEVQPRVVAGTANIKGATQISADDLRRGGNRPGQEIAKASIIKQTANAVQPAQVIPPPQALQHNEVGRLGDNPPRAALSAHEPSTKGFGPSNQITDPNQPPRHGATPKESGSSPPAVSKQAPTRERAPAVSAAPPSPRREGPTQRDEPNLNTDDRRGQGASPQVLPTSAPSAKAPAAAPSMAQSKTNVTPPRQDEKKGDDTKKQ